MDQEFSVFAQDTPDRGKLQVNVTSTIAIQPVADATVRIFSGGNQIEEFTTNSSGQTVRVELPAPPAEYSQEPNQPQPFSEYTVQVTADGIYGERTKEAVEAFQEVFDLPVTGIVDFATWYKISQIYVGVSRIAEQD